MITVRIIVKENVINMINVYAPQFWLEDKLKVQFWEKEKLLEI